MGMTLKELLTKGEGTLSAQEAKALASQCRMDLETLYTLLEERGIKILEEETEPSLDVEGIMAEVESAENNNDDLGLGDESEDDNADVAGEPYYEVACPACGGTVYVSEDDLDAGEAICPSCKVAFEVALADEEDDEAAEEDDGPVQYEVTCPNCGATSVVDEDALLDGEPTCPACGKPLDFEVTEE